MSRNWGLVEWSFAATLAATATLTLGSEHHSASTQNAGQAGGGQVITGQASPGVVGAGYRHGGGSVPAAVSGVPIWGGYWLPYYYFASFGNSNISLYYGPPPLAVIPMVGTLGPGPGGNGGPLAGPLPPRRNPAVVPPVPAPKKPDPSRSSQLVTVGDRLFRAGNTHKAAERYEQAARLDPFAAGPRVRLAQVSLMRGQFREAANQFREAELASPGWLAQATDIQTIYSEPADFARQIAKLESHVQANPDDRDAWLVLGAQLYLSGRTRKAADVFLRLADRKPDVALAAFLEATAPADRAPH